LVRFLLAVAIMGIVAGLYETTFGNYLSDVFEIGDQERGALEFPREMPGFLVTFVMGAIASVALNRSAFLAMLLGAAGLAGMAFCDKSAGLGVMTVYLVLWAAGSHINMPVARSIALGLADEGRRASRLAQVGVAGIVGTMIGAGIVSVSMRMGWMSFKGVYLTAAGFAVVAAFVVLSIGRVERHGRVRRTRFVFKRRYTLFYVLSALFGARKQVFITFGPWVLIRLFKRESFTIGDLWLIYSFLGLFVRPLVGRLIDWWGEKKTLVVDGVLLACVCTTYAVAGRYTREAVALYAVMAAYVVDQLAFAMQDARATYLSKIVERPEDLAGGLSAGITIDHAVSMTIPFVGGVVWAAFGFQYVFWGAAVVALSSSVASLFIRIPADEPTEVSSVQGVA
jgi:MFS family permease